MKTKCPLCGSNNMTSSEEQQIISMPFGGSKEITIKNYTCSTCGCDGDLFNENDDVIKTGYAELQRKAAAHIADYFRKKSISMSAIERALSLPQRTIAKWKNGDTVPSAAGSALLKFIRLFPWLLDVADADYDTEAAGQICIQSAVRDLLRIHTQTRGPLQSASIASFATDYCSGLSIVAYSDDAPTTAHVPTVNCFDEYESSTAYVQS